MTTFKSHCKVCGKPLGVFDNDTCGDCKRWLKVIEDIKVEIAEYKDDKVIHAERNEMIDIVLEIIDRHCGKEKHLKDAGSFADNDTMMSAT